MEILIGLLIIAIGSFCQSSSYVPIKKVKEWSWESFWLIQGVFAWLVFPFPGFTTGCTPREQFVRLVGSRRCWNEHLLWYIVGSRRFDFRTFHALFGGCTGTEYLIRDLCRFRNPSSGSFAGTNLFEGNRLILLLGVCITLAGIAIIGYAGSLRAQNMSEEENVLL